MNAIFQILKENNHKTSPNKESKELWVDANFQLFIFSKCEEFMHMHDLLMPFPTF